MTLPYTRFWNFPFEKRDLLLDFQSQPICSFSVLEVLGRRKSGRKRKKRKKKSETETELEREGDRGKAKGKTIYKFVVMRD